MIKIGILTYHRVINYGAFLQAVCLCKRLNSEKDITAQIIDFDLLSSQQHYSVGKVSLINRIIGYDFFNYKKTQIKAFERGLTEIKDLLSEDTLISDDMNEFREFVKDKYDIIIVGSDEVWQIKSFRGFPNPYFLPDDVGARKLTYAASARMDYGTLSDERHMLLNKLISDFEFVSVRDKLTYEAIKKEGIPENRMALSCDPSFLIDIEAEDCDIYDFLQSKGKTINKNKKLLVLAGINQKNAELLVEQLSDEYNIISTYKRIKLKGKCINIPDLDQFEWKYLLSKADFVITSLFHGACFSIVQGTPFIAIGTESKKHKLQELLTDSELSDNYIDAEKVFETDWKQLIQKLGDTRSYREFVLKQRSGFSCLLDVIRCNQ